jgi:hypothetical protein
MEIGTVGDSKTSTPWPCTLVEGERATDGEPMVPLILIICLCNVMIYSYVIHVAGIPC